MTLVTNLRSGIKIDTQYTIVKCLTNLLSEGRRLIMSNIKKKGSNIMIVGLKAIRT